MANAKRVSTSFFYIPTMTYKDLFIDLDDTIWDFKTNSLVCLQEVYHDYGFDKFYPTFQDYYKVFHPSNENLWSLYRQGKIDRDHLIVERILAPIRPFGITSPTYAIEVSDDYLERTTMQTALIDGSIELLDYLKPRYRMHILSNGFTEVQYKKIENSGLSSYFDKVILSEDAGVNKPHPDIFAYALKQAHAQPQSTLMIGDSWDADIVGARDSHIDQIWFNPHNESANGFAPTHTVASLKEICKIL